MVSERLTVLIFFDLDDTLLDHKTTANRAVRRFYKRYSGRVPYAQEKFVEIWYSLAKKVIATHPRDELGWDELIRLRIREVFQPFEPRLSNDDVESRFADYLQAYEESWVLFSDVLPCLEALRDRGLGVITNGPIMKQNQKLSNLQIHDRFNVVITSEGMGASKPDAHIFKQACQLAGVLPNDCVYVGDRLETDARASAAVGMRGIWLNRKGIHDETVSGDVEVIESLSELPELLTDNA